MSGFRLTMASVLMVALYPVGLLAIERSGDGMAPPPPPASAVRVAPTIPGVQLQNAKSAKDEALDYHGPNPKNESLDSGQQLPKRFKEADVIDPTRATPAFEKTFRELSKGMKGAGGNNPAPVVRPKTPKITLVGRITGAGRRGAVYLKGDDQILLLTLGEEATLMVGGEAVTLRLDRLDEDHVHVYLMQPYNESIILH